MVDPHLSSDESVIMAADRVLYKSVSLALILTSKRILLVSEKGGTLAAEEILLSKLRSAEIDSNAVPDPAIRLSFVTDRGETKHEALIFSAIPGKQRKGDCEEWVQHLNEHILPSLGEDIPQKAPPSGHEQIIRFGQEPTIPPVRIPLAPMAGEKSTALEKTTDTTPAAASKEEIMVKHDRPAGLVFPDMPPIPESPVPEPPAPAPLRKIITIAALVVIVLAVIAGAVLLTQVLPARPGATSPPVMTPLATTAIPTVLTPVPTTLPPAPLTKTPPVTEQQAAVPTGSVTPLPTPSPAGSPAATIIPSPAATATLSPTTPVPTPSPTAMVTLSPTTPSPTPSPTATATLSAPQVLVPKTGIWARVQYAGNFTGSVTAGAYFMPIEGSGDRFYQLATKGGIIGVSIQKEDTSGNRLIVDIYQNGTSVGHGTTMAPKGEVDFQVELKAA
jgi:hypothetical protein